MIQPNVPNRLPSAYLPYRITVLVLGMMVLFGIVTGFLMVASFVSSQPGATQTQTVNGFQQQIPATPFSATPFILAAAVIFAAIAILGIFYQFLYYSLFSFTVGDGKITVASGVVFRSEKSTAFEEVQTVAVKRGPFLSLFGLGKLQGFTSSPDQIKIVRSGKGGSYTTYHPDIDLVLASSDAESLRTQVGSTVKRVEVVSPASSVSV